MSVVLTALNNCKFTNISFYNAN